MKFNLQRIRPFEGLCLTVQDLLDEQNYHRQNLSRSHLRLHGYGIVQGLTVELQQRKGEYVAVINSGFGITRSGQAVSMDDAVAVRLELPPKDGTYMLWLFHVETTMDKSQRPVFDTSMTEASRIQESSSPRLHPDGQEFPDGIALCRILVRMGRMQQDQWPVPRAGRQERAAESYLKPRVVEFIENNRKVVDLLFRTEQVREMELPTLSFNASLISSQFMLIEEGTSDRVLYRTAGTLIGYAHDFYNSLPQSLDSIHQFREALRKVNSELPNPNQSNEVWLRWFRSFDRILVPLQRLADDLVRSIGPQR